MTPREAIAEVDWVIREAVALSDAAPPAGASIEQRTAYVRRWQRYERRKRRLLAYIEACEHR